MALRGAPIGVAVYLFAPINFVKPGLRKAGYAVKGSRHLSIDCARCISLASKVHGKQGAVPEAYALPKSPACRFELAELQGPLSGDS
jgi:hypothetical protein